MIERDEDDEGKQPLDGERPAGGQARYSDGPMIHAVGKLYIR